jgi:hypothetical protein
MTDITKCNAEIDSGVLCPLRETCFRYMAASNKLRQSFFANAPYAMNTEDCDHYWKISSKSEVRRLNHSWED